MGAFYTILTVLQVILALAVVVLILLQQSKSAGLSSALGGSMETFFSKNGNRSSETVMRRLTIILGIVLAVNTILMSVLG